MESCEEDLRELSLEPTTSEEAYRSIEVDYSGMPPLVVVNSEFDLGDEVQGSEKPFPSRASRKGKEEASD